MSKIYFTPMNEITNKICDILYHHNYKYFKTVNSQFFN